VKSARINLVLLTCEALQNWILEGINPRAAGGGVYDGESLEGALRIAVEKKIENMINDPGMEKWYSYYGIVYRNKIVGLVGPKGKSGVPDWIEIGYGIGEKYRGRGIATAAVTAICRRYQMKEKTKRIIAVTDAGNIASERVLIKAGFKEKERTKEKTDWEKVIFEM
jgi:RimJ/RimL family protein N-acetyltransferase